MKGLPDRGGYLLADEGLAEGAGMWSPEEFGGYMRVGRVADTVGHMPVDMGQRVADKGWGENTYLLGLAGSDHHASWAAWVSHSLVGSMGHCMAHQPARVAFAHI